MSTIEIKNVGPISAIDIDLPESEPGGVRILRGTSGTGKTTVLKVLQALLGDKDAVYGITPHDGADRGEVKGLGRTVKIGGRITATGSAEVANLSRLDIATLVEPKVAKPDARLRERVACLVSLGGRKVSIQELLGDQYDKLVEHIDVDELSSESDPVVLAEKLKRSLDRSALEIERESDRESGRAQAKRQEAGDADTLNESLSYQDCVAAHSAALSALNDANSRKTQAAENEQFNKQVLEQVATFADYDIAGMEATLVAANNLVENLRLRYEKAQENAREAKRVLDEAKRAVSKVDELKKSIKPAVVPPTDEEIQSLSEAAERALKRLNEASSIDSRKRAWDESQECQDHAAELAEQAAELRSAATSVIERVQSALPAGQIEIRDGELMVKQSKRGKYVPFEDLSTGEKWKVAMNYAIGAVGTGGVLVMAQESWQALGPELKVDVATLCRDKKVWLITGEVDEGELRVEGFENE